MDTGAFNNLTHSPTDLVSQWNSFFFPAKDFLGQCVIIRSPEVLRLPFFSTGISKLLIKVSGLEVPRTLLRVSSSHAGGILGEVQEEDISKNQMLHNLTYSLRGWRMGGWLSHCLSLGYQKKGNYVMLRATIEPFKVILISSYAMASLSLVIYVTSAM